MNIKNYTAAAAIVKYRIVKPATDGAVSLATAATDSLIGVVDIPADAPAGARVDVVRDGMALIELGGTVAAGDFLTADANAMAITAAPAAGANMRTIAIAETSGVAGDVIYAQIEPGSIQG